MQCHLLPTGADFSRENHRLIVAACIVELVRYLVSIPMAMLTTSQLAG